MKKHIVPAFIAVTFGFVGFAFAKALQQKVSVELTLGAGAVTTIESFLNAQACDAIESEGGLAADTCAASDIDRVFLYRFAEDGVSGWKMVTEAKFNGTWTKAP